MSVFHQRLDPFASGLHTFDFPTFILFLLTLVNLNPQHPLPHPFLLPPKQLKDPGVRL